MRSQAEYWAQRKGKEHKTNGYVTEFNFIESAFEYWELQVLRFDSYTEEWLDFIVMNRNVNRSVPAHDYDIVEGPLADDDVTQRIDDYLGGAVSKADFLEELKFRHPTHQIGLCTHRSLQALEQGDKKYIKSMDSSLVEALITDYDMTEEKAVDLYFTSSIYRQIVDVSTGLYQKPWTEIYQLLLKELNLKI
jgi:hypothetical protein